MKNEFTAIIERDGDWYIAYCPEIPGANGQGRTKDEARENLAEAIELIDERAAEARTALHGHVDHRDHLLARVLHDDLHRRVLRERLLLREGGAHELDGIAPTGLLRVLLLPAATPRDRECQGARE